jgi:ketosteroid isomerase-like protein
MAVDLERLEARIKRLEDIEDIRALRMQYHHRMNEFRFRDAETLYTDDALVDFQGLAVAKGHPAIGELFERLQNNVTFLKQFITTHMVTLNGDEASGVSYLDARYTQEGKSIIAALRYDDKYRRTPKGWMFTEMLVIPYFSVPIQQGWAKEKLSNLKFVEGEA